MSGLKIAIFGGGSSYTPEIIEGFILRHSTLPVREIHLVDIPEGREKMSIVGALAQRMVKKAGLDIQVVLTEDRDSAIEGADFVTTQLRVGLLDARIKDERIPLKHGTLGQETNGAGGMFKAFRTIPVVLDIARRMERLAPNAKLINFANPSGIVTEAVLKHTKIDIMGLCNVPIGIQMNVAKLLDVDASRIDIDFAGLNHLVWGLNVRLDGRDVKAEVLAGLADDKNFTMKNIRPIKWPAGLLETLDAIPCPYHRYYYMHDEMLAEELKDAAPGGKGTRGEVVKKVEAELFELYKDPNLAIKPPQLMQRGGAYYSDAACNLINSIYNNKKDIHVVNIRNNGAIADLPDNVSIECNAVVGKYGAKPITVGRFPKQLVGLLQQVKAYEELTVEAAVTGDYDTALRALVANPFIPTVSVAKPLLDEMFAAHAEYLPQFKVR
ncbi:MAG TPA: 6-phospho-beta-glucosidase [Candidatus Sulfotelmatobacter sp.]|nr:6-phospho-beta-glucosidase [Candidatus Sulfotelmatobacter sp.]HWI65380.1 6-phospho-beta-glucosidase [Symbiobacteriaceae bacterium]